MEILPLLALLSLVGTYTFFHQFKIHGFLVFLGVVLVSPVLFCGGVLLYFLS